MRHIIALALLTTQAQAWEFASAPICTLTHSEDAADITITYDHTTGLYAIAITTPQGWRVSPAFSIRFDGQRPNIISTQDHKAEGNRLTVSDTGFGNVLDGLEFNATATAFTADRVATVSLAGAAEPVRQFRACATAPIA